MSKNKYPSIFLRQTKVIVLIVLQIFSKFIMVHTLESFRKIRNKTFSVRLESCGHLIKSIKLKKRPFPCDIAPVMCVLKKWYVSS